MIKEAIILAGGLGTRLRSKIRDIPKPMAPVGEKPFLAYLLDFLVREGFKRAILAVGYKGNFIYNYFGNKYNGLELTYSFEDEKKLLGTGGAILKASRLIENEYFFVFNGDTFFDVDTLEMMRFHVLKKADITLALKPFSGKLRYGFVELDEDGRIINFIEKGKSDTGLINGGVYIISKAFFKNLVLPEKFSFEIDFLQKYFKQFRFFGYVFDRYFIDIGVPEDYERAKTELDSFASKSRKLMLGYEKDA